MNSENAQDDACESTNCAEAVSSLHQFLDAELTDDTRSAIQGHLDACPGCYQAFGFEKDLRSAVSDRLQTQIPDGLAARIRSAIEST